MNKDTVIQKIGTFVERYRGTSLGLDEMDDDYVLFSTRENGDVGSEEAGQEDVNDAYNMKKEILKEFSDGIEVEVEIVDEWVMLTAKLK